MKKSNIFLITLILATTQYQNSFSMEDIRPGDPQRVDNLSEGESQELIRAQIRQGIEMIKLLIQENGGIGLRQLLRMGYNTGAISIACNELGDRAVNIKRELDIYNEERNLLRIQNEQIKKERKQEEQQIQMLLEQTKRENTINEIKKIIEDAFVSSEISYDFILQLMSIGYSETDIQQAFIELESYQLYENSVNPIMEEPSAPEIPETNTPETPKPSAPEIRQDQPDENELRTKQEIAKLVVIINAMQNPNAMLSLPILTRIQYAQPKDLSLADFVKFNFAKEDIIAACQQIGLENIPENLRNELF